MKWELDWVGVDGGAYTGKASEKSSSPVMMSE